MPGTIEAVTLELAKAIEPLHQRLASPQGAVALFAELGLPLPNAVTSAIAGAPEIAQIAAAATAVAGQIPSLVDAIDERDAAAIAAVVEQLAPQVRGAVTGLKALAGRVRTAFGTNLGGFSDELRDLITALPERLVAWLVVSYLEQHRPVIAAVLALPGLIERTPFPDDGLVRRELRLDRASDLLADPVAVLRTLYHWGDPVTPLDAEKLLTRLGDLLTALGFLAVLDPGPGPGPVALKALLFTLRGAPNGIELGLVLPTLPELDFRFTPPGSRVEGRIRAAGELRLGPGLRIEPPGALVPLVPTLGLDGRLALSARLVPPDDGPVLVFGSLDGTRLTASSVRAAVGVTFAAGVRAGLEFDAAVEGGELVVSFAGADGFLSSVLAAELRAAVALGLRWTEDGGLVLGGGAGLATTIPLSLDLGPARLDRLDVAITPGIAVEARLAGSIALGPFAATVEGVGAGLVLSGGAQPGAVDLGAASVGLRFVPPSGIALGVDAGPVSGGGFIAYDDATGRYTGVLQLGVDTVAVDAVGLLDTRLPGGTPAFALLALLRAEFPPVAVGFGFSLTAVGGLLALNRRVDVDVLRARLAAGTAGRILAPEDPVGNAPALLADLDAAFPVAEGVTVVGPTLRLTWSRLVRFDLGVFVELPGPARIALLGSARASIENPGSGRVHLQLRMDVVGIVDLARQVAEFDAVLVDSSLLEILEITGGAAFRLSWGAQPYVVLSVGGFHPAYSPAPLVLPPTLTRVAMTRGVPTDALYLRFEGYFAVTSNTLQFGASVEVVLNAGDFHARGFLGFDTLLRFQPFAFAFGFTASVTLRYKDHTLAGVALTGEVSGPGPVVFRGRACVEILFVDICWEGTFTLGSSTPPAVTPVANAVDALLAEFDDPANLRSGAADPAVAVTPPEDGVSLPVVSPAGQLVWSQERAPLGLFLQRMDGAPLTRPETVTVTGPHVAGSELDWFAPGLFVNLSDADALTRRSFERLSAGVRIGPPSVASGPSATATVTVRQIRPPAAPTTRPATALPAWLLRAGAARTGAVERAPVVPALQVRDETWNVHSPAGAIVTGGLTGAQAHQLATVAGIAAVESDPVAAFAF